MLLTILNHHREKEKNVMKKPCPSSRGPCSISSLFNEGIAHGSPLKSVGAEPAKQVAAMRGIKTYFSVYL